MSFAKQQGKKSLVCTIDWLLFVIDIDLNTIVILGTLQKMGGACSVCSSKNND